MLGTTAGPIEQGMLTISLLELEWDTDVLLLEVDHQYPPAGLYPPRDLENERSEAPALGVDIDRVLTQSVARIHEEPTAWDQTSNIPPRVTANELRIQECGPKLRIGQPELLPGNEW